MIGYGFFGYVFIMVKLKAVVFVVNCISTGNYLLALVFFGGRRGV